MAWHVAPQFELVYEEDDPFDDWNPYNWAVSVVLYKDGGYYTARDSGCSCNWAWDHGVDLSGPMPFPEALKVLSPLGKERAMKWRPGMESVGE